MKKLFTFHILNILLFIGFFTIILPVLYYVFMSDGWAYLFDVVHDKYNPTQRRRISNFFKTWY